MKPDAATIARGRLATPLARIGVILPTSNRLIEPQFQHYAPPELGVHFERARITGKWARSIAELASEVARAAGALADTRPDLIVFNCTGTSMKEGAEGDAHLLNAIRNETGIAAMSTAEAVVEALCALKLRKLVLVTPYAQATNDHEIDYLRSAGFDVVHGVALGLAGSDHYIGVPPERWIDIALANDRPDAHGFFLSCTNTTQIEAVAVIESATGKPVVASNQAVLWAAVNRIGARIGGIGKSSVPGRLNGLAV